MEDLAEEGMMLLKSVLQKYDETWPGLIWLMTETSGRAGVNTLMNVWVPQNVGRSCIADKLLTLKTDSAPLSSCA